MVEVNKGVIIIGFANTVLFGGDQTIELLLLDLATGRDFSLPITDVQAEHLLQHVTLEDMLDMPEDTEDSHEQENSHAHEEVALPNDEALRQRLDGIINSSVAPEEEGKVVPGVADAWAATETTSQF